MDKQKHTHKQAGTNITLQERNYWPEQERITYELHSIIIQNVRSNIHSVVVFFINVTDSPKLSTVVMQTLRQ